MESLDIFKNKHLIFVTSLKEPFNRKSLKFLSAGHLVYLRPCPVAGQLMGLEIPFQPTDPKKNKTKKKKTKNKKTNKQTNKKQTSKKTNKQKNKQTKIDCIAWVYFPQLACTVLLKRRAFWCFSRTAAQNGKITHKPNSLSRFDYLRSEVKREPWEQIKFWLIE